MSEETDPKPLISAGFNPRFPNTNQTRNCWANYLEFQRCITTVPEEDREDVCSKFERGHKHLCPPGWVEKWDSQVENVMFPGQEAYLLDQRRGNKKKDNKDKH
ncbi:hypothetical protein PROFUN_02267 [Planoprotostelium fungivorum]|uniref:Cytochrome c oxidase subunit n=1 Tax=Planoprotostelium fungivorum TaxID=1890364 RepID=A0A2P6NYG5_9EUKA|nr:hypothetical protein PROFUN_02267 [Planoprotostelium fungivorum]